MELLEFPLDYRAGEDLINPVTRNQGLKYPITSVRIKWIIQVFYTMNCRKDWLELCKIPIISVYFTRKN
jgi:hypothetical protein